MSNISGYVEYQWDGDYRRKGLPADALYAELDDADGDVDLDDVTLVLVDESLGYGRLDGNLALTGVCLMRADDSVSHLLVVGDVQKLHLREQLYSVGFSLRSRQHTGIHQDLLQEADAAENPAVLTLGSTVLVVLAEVTLVAGFLYGLYGFRQTLLDKVVELVVELVVAFL